MSRIHFLEQYAVKDRHYDLTQELNNAVHGTYDQQYWASSHPKLDHSQMLHLAQSDETVIRARIASRHDVPMGILYNLYHGDTAYVRHVASMNPLVKTKDFRMYIP